MMAAGDADIDTNTLYGGNLNEPSHLLYIHPSDNPNNILVSDLLNGDNYNHWKKAMEIALVAKNKLGFVLGHCVKPSAVSLLAHWERCDKMVLSWIMNVVIKDIAQSVLFSATARDVWTQLEQRFGEADGTKAFQIQRDLCVISQGHLSVTEYFTQIKKLWDAYNSIISLPCCSTSGEACVSLVAAKKIIQDQQLMQFLVGLHEDYKNVRGNILMIKPLPSLDQVYQIVLQEEKQRSLSSTASISGSSTAFHSYFPGDFARSGQFQQKAHNQGQGYSRSNSTFGSHSSQFNSEYNKAGQKTNFSDRNIQERKAYYCDHCKISGHSTQRCFKLHGYPPGHRMYRGKKIAAIAQTETHSEVQASQSQAPHTPALTTEQYNQLIQLLQHHSSDLERTNEGGSVAGFFAGPHHTEGSAPW